MSPKRLKVLALEPYYGGSHKAILDGLCSHSRHEIKALTLPARKWKWRMRGSAIEFAERLRGAERPDLLLTNDMTSVTDLRALGPAWAHEVPIVTYFHENQLTYPMPDESQRDYQYGFTNITSCLASTEVWFNSEYHRQEFLAAAEALLRKMPDHVPEGVISIVRAISDTVHVGVYAPCSTASGRRRPRTVIWNQRWEWDKNPEAFFEAVFEVRRRGVDFRIAVLGEKFRVWPAIFDEAREKLAESIVAWGYLPSFIDYLATLATGDIVMSTAHHEFFGVGAVEAAAAGCVPLLPKRLSYPEVFDVNRNPQLFYDEGTLADRLEALLVSEALPSREEVRKLAEPYFWEERIKEWDERLLRAASR